MLHSIIRCPISDGVLTQQCSHKDKEDRSLKASWSIDQSSVAEIVSSIYDELAFYQFHFPYTIVSVFFNVFLFKCLK